MTDHTPLDPDDPDEPVTADDTPPEQAESSTEAPTEAPDEAPVGLITLGSAGGVVCEGDHCWIPPES